MRQQGNRRAEQFGYFVEAPDHDQRDSAAPWRWAQTETHAVLARADAWPESVTLPLAPGPRAEPLYLELRRIPEEASDPRRYPRRWIL